MKKYPKPQPIERPLWQWLLVAAILLALIVAGVGHVHYRPLRSDAAYPYASSARPPESFRFQPKPDITAYELALALAPMMGTTDFLERMRKFYDAMPLEAKRHWLTPESAPPPPAHEHPH